MKLKRIIASVCAAVMIPITSSIPLRAAEATEVSSVTFTGWAQLRAETNDYDKYVSGASTVIKTADDTIQIFSNNDGNSNQSQCGAYFQYEVPSNWKTDDTIALTLTLTDTSAVADELYVIAAGTENAGKASSDTYTIENVWKDVQSAYKDTGKMVLTATPTSKTYLLDITSLVHTGTNALYVYTRDQKGKIYYVNSASITYNAWTAKSEENLWSLSNDRINGYANIGEHNSIITTMVADNTNNLYESDNDVKTAFDGASFKGNTPSINSNCNIMGMIARAGSASNHIFKKDVKYTLHYTLSGSWENAVDTSPNGAYLNCSLWTAANNRKDNKTNQNVMSKSSESPVNKTYEFTPAEDCYAEFNFELRRVKTGGYMTVSDIYVTAESVNGLPEITVTPTPDPDITPKPTIEINPPEGKAWSEVWSYDFNDYTDTKEYSSGKIPLSNAYPHQAPAITWGKGTVSSASGIYGMTSDDRCMKISSTTAGGEPARILFDLTNTGTVVDKTEFYPSSINASASTTYNRRFVDDTIDCLVSFQDVAFATTTEKRYVSSYRIIGTPYNGLVFDNDGTIKYHDHNLKYQSTGKTYAAKTWYNVMVRYDFKNNQITYYLDGEKIAEDAMPQSGSDARYQFGEISIKASSNAADPGTIYLDNLKLCKEEDDTTNYLSSEIISMYKSSFLTGENIEFAGRVNDGKDDAGFPETKIYLDETLLDTVTKNTYSVKKSDLTAGEHTFKAVSTTSDNRTITKEKKVFVADFSMPTTYGDGMVLQRNKPIKIAGFGKDGTAVTVTLNNISKETVVSNGKFEVIFDAQSAVSSTTLSISAGGVTKTYNNVAIGEVILCNGQSKMAYSLARFTEIHNLWDKDYDNIRFFEQDEIQVPNAQTDILSGRWVNATKMNALYFSGFAYGTARKLQELIGSDVVIGLVKTAIGGTSINTWVPKGAFDNDPDLYAKRNTGRTAYNAMVAPLTDYTVGSVMWYQGEADTSRDLNYEKMLTRYIDCMREEWSDPNLPFAIVLLPIYNYDTAKTNKEAAGVREGEWNVSQKLDNVVTVVGIDTGNYKDIHPNDKSILCGRMAKVLDYFINPTDNSKQYLSPSVESYSYNETDKTMTFTFMDTYGGLKTKDNESPRGFKVAGDDNNYKDTTAAISGNTVVVDTSNVTGTPKVRYAWEDGPSLASDGKTTELNLQNSAGFAATPFRSDNDKYHYKNNEIVNFVPMIRNITSKLNEDGSTDIIVNVRDYDGDEIQSVEIFVDGTSVGTTSTKNADSETEYVLNYTNASAGEHKVYAIATDTAGGISTTQDSKLSNISVEPYKYSLVFEEKPSPSPSATPDVTPTPSPSATPDVTPSPSPSATPDVTPTPSPSATPDVTPTPSPSATPDVTPTPSPSATPDVTPTPEYITPLEAFVNKITVEKKENKLVITPINDIELQTLVLYIAIYNEDNTLKSVAMTVREAENGILTIPIDKPLIAENETYKMFLWTEKYEPVIKSIQSEK